MLTVRRGLFEIVRQKYGPCSPAAILAQTKRKKIWQKVPYFTKEMNETSWKECQSLKPT